MDADLWQLLHTSERVFLAVRDRIYWGLAPQGSPLPRIVLTIISGADAPHLQGTDGLWNYRVQVDCYGEDRPAARALSRHVVACLNGHRSTRLRGIFCTATREHTDTSGTQKSARISHDFTVKWRA